MQNNGFALKKVFLFPTMSCNLNCKMCYSSSRVHAQFRNLNIDEYKIIINKLYDYGVRLFDISGGEPFSSSILHELVYYIKSLNETKIFLVSNGTLIAEKYDYCLDIIKQVDRLQISLDSLIPEQHNEVRQNYTAFERTIFAIEKLSKDCKAMVGINTVIIDSNQEQIIPILNFALEHKIQNVSFLRFIDVVENKSEQLNVKINEFNIMLTRLEQWVAMLTKNGLSLDVEFVLPGFMFSEVKNHRIYLNGITVKVVYDPLRGCHAFESNAVVTHSGNLTGCTALVKYPEMYCGNILTDKDNGFINTYKEFRKSLKDREEYLRGTEPCKSCNLFHICRGGCPASTYNTYKSIMYPDPTCPQNILIT